MGRVSWAGYGDIPESGSAFGIASLQDDGMDEESWGPVVVIPAYQG